MNSRRVGILVAGCLAVILAAPAAASAQSPAAGAEVTFAKDIAPILQRSCQQCHRPASVAPMSLLTYEQARPWARSIKARTQLRNKRGAMPPWFIEKDIGIQQFKDDISLSDDEIEKIATWADSGAPLGNPADLPPPLEFRAENEWEIGEPDLIVESPSVVVPAAAPDKWTSLGTIPTGLTEDRYVAAVEVKEFNDIPPDAAGDTVGGRYVFHHMTYGAVMPEGADVESATRFPVHEVGRNADIFPEVAGRLLPAGSHLELETAHLHSNGRETRAHLKFAFKLHPKGYEPEISHSRTFIGNGVDIDIKPNQADQELHAYRVLDRHTKILSFEPHQHAPGMRMCVEAIWGHNIETLNCVGYDHNWVRGYTYAQDHQPLLPKGTVLHIVGYMDNSEENRNVPDPRNWQGSGNRSVANMFIDLGMRLSLTQEQFEQEMAERRERLGLTKNDHVIGCPLCMVMPEELIADDEDEVDAGTSDGADGSSRSTGRGGR
ncbi:MAG: cytochrome c [Gemmatimonadetes bacterium]|nr:cytochrome c [Gemmatimonadota bacterium]